MSNNRREAIIERIMLARYEFSLITARLDLAKAWVSGEWAHRAKIIV